MMAEKQGRKNKLNKYIGVEGVFYKKGVSTGFQVFKKSAAVKVRGTDFLLRASNILRKYASKATMHYAGISDVYNIGGKPDHGVFLGRTAYYELNTKIKARTLAADLDYGWMKQMPPTLFFVSLVFFVKGRNTKESFTVLFNLAIRTSGRSLVKKISKIASSKKIRNIINLTSLDITSSDKLYFIGVNWIEQMEPKALLFNTSQADVRGKNAIQNEVEAKKALTKKLNNILANNVELSLLRP